MGHAGFHSLVMALSYSPDTCRATVFHGAVRDCQRRGENAVRTAA